MNAYQSPSSKIKALRDALYDAGFLTLAQQASALGLARSTTWHILQANHKGSGLSARVINRILAAPKLPAPARAAILAYVADKISGLYGHRNLQRHRFAAQLSPEGRARLRAQGTIDHANRVQTARSPADNQSVWPEPALAGGNWQSVLSHRRST